MEKKISLLFISSFIVFLWGLPVSGFANLEKPIIVSAEKFERPYEKSTSTILKLEREEIEKSGATNVADLLKTQAGVTLLSSGPFGKASSLFIRGTSNRHTLVIIDGMRVTDLTAIGGGSRLEFLSTANIESIEVLKGSQGVLYGGEAIGGVLKITTKDKVSGSNASRFKLGAGSFGQFSLGAISNLSPKKDLGLLQVSHERADGISAYSEARSPNAELDGFETTNVRYKKDLKFKKVSWQLETFFQDSSSEFDSSTGDVTGNETSYQTHGAQGLMELDLYDALKPQVSLEYRRIKTDSQVASSNSLFIYDGSSVRTELNLPWLVSESFEVLTGLSGEREIADALDSRFISSKSRDRYSLFSQARKEWGGIFTEAGARFESIESIDKRALYRVAFGFNYGNWTFKAHQATGFKAPSLYQNFSVYGNRDLVVERSLSREISALYVNREQAYQFELSLFSIDYSNFVDFDNSTNRYENLGAQENYGLEASTSFKLLNATVNWESNLLRAYNPDTGSYALRRPRQRHSFGLERALSYRWLGRLSGIYVGEREERSRIRMPSYLTFDLHFAYNEDPNTDERVLVDFKNILNREYEEIRNFATPGQNILVTWERGF